MVEIISFVLSVKNTSGYSVQFWDFSETFQFLFNSLDFSQDSLETLLLEELDSAMAKIPFLSSYRPNHSIEKLFPSSVYLYIYYLFHST